MANVVCVVCGKEAEHRLTLKCAPERSACKDHWPHFQDAYKKRYGPNSKYSFLLSAEVDQEVAILKGKKSGK